MALTNAVPLLGIEKPGEWKTTIYNDQFGNPTGRIEERYGGGVVDITNLPRGPNSMEINWSKLADYALRKLTWR